MWTKLLIVLLLLIDHLVDKFLFYTHLNILNSNFFFVKCMYFVKKKKKIFFIRKTVNAFIFKQVYKQV